MENDIKRAENLDGHINFIRDEMIKIQGEFADKEHLPVKTIKDMANRFLELQSCGQLLMSMKEIMFPGQIVTPKKGGLIKNIFN